MVEWSALEEYARLNEDYRRIELGPASVRAKFGIDRIHRRSNDANEDLARGWFRPLHFTQLTTVELPI